MGAVTAAVVAATAAIAGTAKQVSDSRKQQRQAESAARKQERATAALETDLNKRIEGEDVEANRAQSTARERQRILAAGAQGRRSTIKTSPLGLLDEPQTANKQLLGQ